MQLSQLEPKLKGDILVFDCPCGKCGGRIRVPLAWNTTEKAARELSKWAATGTFPALTLLPSVNAGCWHGNIVKGEMITAEG